MSRITIGQKTESHGYFCPNCHNPIDVGLPLLGEMLVSCACGWNGNESQALQTHFKHEFRDNEEIFEQMIVEVRNLLAKNSATIYGSFLLKWGFLDQPLQRAQLARYLIEIAKATVNAIIQTRRLMVEEAAREQARMGRA